MDPLGQDWGRGPQHPRTGQFDHYDYPVGHPKHPDAPPRVTWLRILQAWPELVYDFQHLLHVDLIAVWPAARWHWFVAMVEGLLAQPESLLRQQLVEKGA